MKKIVTALVLFCFVVSSFAGCDLTISHGSTEHPHEQFSTTVPVQVQYEGFYSVDRSIIDIKSEYYSSAELNRGYESLESEAMRICYKKIDNSVYYIAKEKSAGKEVYNTLKITLQGQVLSEAELRVVISAYFCDHPQVYWIDNNFEYAVGSTKTVLQLFSFMSGREIELSAEKLSKKANEVISKAGRGLDEYERELFIHDRVVEACDYAEDVKSIQDDYKAFTAYGALVEGKAVCEGYSRLFQMLLSAVGIESYGVLGVGSYELHMWNCVEIYGDWYYVDTTWAEDKEVGVCYDYFNLSTDQLEIDHVINPLYSELTDEQICGNEWTEPKSFNVIVPECNDKNQNYYQKSAVTIDDFSQESKDKLKEAIIFAAENCAGERFPVYIHIGTGMYYDYAVENLFYSGEFFFFSCLDEINEEGKVSIDRYNVSIRRIGSMAGVNVYLSTE